VLLTTPTNNDHTSTSSTSTRMPSRGAAHTDAMSESESESESHAHDISARNRTGQTDAGPKSNKKSSSGDLAGDGCVHMRTESGSAGDIRGNSAAARDGDIKDDGCANSESESCESKLTTAVKNLNSSKPAGGDAGAGGEIGLILGRRGGKLAVKLDSVGVDKKIAFVWPKDVVC
jgi:hypothetical protein